MLNRLARLLCLSLGIHFAMPISVCAQAEAGAVASTTPTAASSSASPIVLTAANTGSALSVSNTSVLVIDLSSSSSINLSGNLTNAGSIYAISTNPAVTTGSISAANIFNLAGATISTVLPTGGLAGFANALPNFNLILNATRNLTNLGTISGANNLSAIAGNTISNHGVMQAAGTLTAIAPNIQNLSTLSGLTASMQAIGNLNLTTNSLVNQGLIASANGNINVLAAIASNLNINNAMGSLRALNGSLNFGASDLIGKIDTTISGGNLLSKELNIYSGCGTVNLDAESVTGKLNLFAGEAHVNAATETLSLGSIHLSGDPTFYNKIGDIVINTDLVFPGSPLAIVAQGNIITAAGAGKIDTSSSTGNGGDITLIAGANFTTTGACCVTPGQPGDTTSTLSITGTAPAGGNIDLKSGTAITSLTSQSTAANGNGGKITLVAFGGLPGIAAAGSVTIPTALTITSSGSGSGNNGDVTILAGGTAAGNAISTGSVNASGGSGTSAYVTIQAGAPQVYDGPTSCSPCVTVHDGSITAGTFYGGFSPSLGTILISGTVNVNGSGSATGGSIDIGTDSNTPFVFGAGATVSGITGNLTAKGGPAGGAGGNINVYLPNANVTLTSSSNLDVTPYQGNGGGIGVTCATLTTPAITLDGRAAGGNFDGGSLNVSITGLSTTAGALTANASASGSGNGGYVQLDVNGKIGTGLNEIRGIANGGTAGSSAGDGGFISFSTTTKSMVVNAGGLDVAPLGVNGKGGLISTFLNGGTLKVNGSLDVSGVGSGDGGIIDIDLLGNPGLLFAIGSSAAQGVTGSLIANAGNTGSNAGSINVRADASITVSKLGSISALAPGGNGGTLLLQTTNTLTMPAGSLSVSGGAGNTVGGSMTLIGNILAMGGALSLSANAAGSGEGGKIVIRATASNLTIGAGALTFSATGGSPGSSAGNGGTLSLTANNLTLNPSAVKLNPLGTNGNGGSLSIVSEANTVVTATVDMSGAGIGNGGAFNLRTGSTWGGGGANMLIGAPSVNGVNGDIIVNAGTGGGSGGTIDVSAVNNGNNLTVLAASNLQFATTDGNGGSLLLSPGFNGTLTLASGTFDADAKGSGNHDGGTIQFSRLAPITLNVSANATGSGNGGTVYVPTSIGFGANQAVVHATGGSAGSVAGDGGHISVNSPSGNLTVDPLALDARPLGLNGKGATIDIYDNGTGLLISGALDASGVGTGDGGSITLSSANSAFTIGAPVAVSGIVGGLSANGGAGGGAGGFLSVDAGAGNLTINDPALFSVAGVRGGGVSLSASATVKFTAGGTLSVLGAVDGGGIGIRSASVSTVGHINLVADGTGTGSGGGISFDLSGGTVNLGAAAGQFSLSINGGATSGNAGGIGIKTTGALNLSSGYSAKVLGSDGDGARLSFITTGAITLPAVFAVDGKGTGNAGGIRIEYSSGALLTIGSITADAPGSGNPGYILIQNTGPTFNLRVNGTISTVSSSGLRGQLILNTMTNTYGSFFPELADPTKVVNLSGNGTINSEILAGGATFTANMTTPLAFGIIRTTGNINITAPSVTVLRGVTDIGDTSMASSFTGWSSYGGGGSWSGPVATKALWQNLPESGAIVSNTSVSITTPSLTNYGLISSTTNGALTINTAGALLVGGTGSFTTSGGAITMSGSSVQFTDAVGFSAGAGTVNLNATSGNITSANCTIQSILTAGSVNITAAKLDFTSAMNVRNYASNSPINMFSTAGGDLNVLVDVTQSPGVRTNGGGINLQANPGFNINVNANGPGSAVLNFLGGPVTFTTNGGAVNVASNVTVSSDNNITFQVNNGILNNNGGIVSNGGLFSGQIAISSTGNATVTGSGHIDAGIPSALGRISLQATAILTIGGTQTLTSGANGNIAITANTVKLSPNANLTISPDTLVRIDTNNLIFGANSQLSLQLTTGQFLLGAAAGPLVITLPAGSTGTISSAGSPIVLRNVFGGNSIQFTSSTAGSPSRLNLLGAISTTINQTNDIQVDAGVLVFSDSPIALSPSSNLINNGSIIDDGAAPDIFIGSTAALTVSGSGSISNAKPGNISLSAFPNFDLNFLGNQTFDPGAGGIVTFTSGGRNIDFSTGTTQTISSGSSLNIQSSSISMGAGASVTTTAGSTNIGISANKFAGAGVVAGGPLAITLPSNKTASIVSAGGTISISTPQALTINTSAAGASALNLNGGGVNINGPSVSIQPGADLTSNDVITLSASASGLTLNTNVSSSKSISVSAAGAITRTAGTLIAPTVTLSTIGGANIGATGQEVFTDTAVLIVSTTGAAFIKENDSVDLNAATVGALTLNTGGNGSIDIMGAVTAAGLLSLNAGGSGAITDAGGFSLTAGSLNLTSTNGDIGAVNAPIVSHSTNLTFSTTGNVYIDQSSASLSIGAASGGSISLTSATDVGLTGAFSAGLLTVNATAAANLTVSAGVDITNKVSITTSTGAVLITGTGTLSSSSDDVQISSSTVTINGGLSSGKAGGQVALVTPGVSLILGGTGTIAATGGGIASISATAQALTVAGSLSFDAGATGTVSLAGTTSVDLTGSATVSSGSKATITTPHLTLGALAQLNATGASNIIISSPANLQITSPAGSTAQLSTNGGNLTITAANGLMFDRSIGLPATMNLSANTMNFSPANGSMTVSAGTTLSNPGDLTISATAIINDGTLSDGGNLIAQSANSIVVSGTGSITGGGLNLISNNGTVTVNQGNISATLTGTSQGDFTVTAGGAGLTIGSTCSNTAAVIVTATAGSLTVSDGATLQAASNVSLTGGTGLRIGTVAGGVTIGAGQLDPMMSASSTNMADYDMSSITTPGTVSLSTTGGTLSVAPNTTITASGGSIGMRAPGDISLAAGDSLFAQGGNIWLNGLGNINAVGTTLVAVARNIPNGAPVAMPVAGVSLAAYQGGSIALDVNTMQPNYDSYLRTNWEQQRDPLGTNSSSGPGIVTTGTTTTYTNGGTVALVTSDPNKVSGTFLNLLNSTVNSNGGVIYLDPPGSQLNVSNSSFQSFGPQLVAVVPPPPVPPALASGGAALALIIVPTAGPRTLILDASVIASATQTATQGQNARIVPLDTLDLNVPLNTPASNQNQCTPAPLAQFAETSDGQGGWSVASGFCESFTVEGSNGSAIISTGGTHLSPTDSGSLKMQQGKMLAMTGKNPLSITTGATRVRVASESAMIIEESSRGLIRITQMAGAPGVIEIGRNGHKELVPTQAGHEIVVSVGDPEQEELIGVDGIDRIPVGATMKVADLQVRRSQIDPKQLLERSKLLNCTTAGCFPTRLRARLNRMRAEATNPAKLPPISSSKSLELVHPFKSIGFVQAAIPPASPIATLSSPMGIIKHSDVAGFSVVRPGAIILREGEILVSPEKPMVISAGTARVEIQPGAVALVSRENECLRVRCLSEDSASRVIARGGARFVPVRAGQEIVVAPSNDSLTAFLQHDSSPRRRVMRIPSSTGEAVDLINDSMAVN